MKVKKIAALAVGAAMVGATIGFASAQPSVPNIPKEFFVKDGQPNVKIVVGSQGAAQDVAGAADIAVAIGSLLYTEKDVKDASIVVKTTKTETAVNVDPNDIPVFFNYYPKSRDQEWEVGSDKAKDVHGWWNGTTVSKYYREGEWWSNDYEDTRGAIGNQFDYNLSSSYWDDGVFTIDEAKNVHWYVSTSSKAVNPFNFIVKKGIYIKLSKTAKTTLDDKTFTFKEGKVINYNVTIKRIELSGLKDVKDEKDPSALEDLNVMIPKGNVTVSISFIVGETRSSSTTYCMYCNCSKSSTHYSITNGPGDATFIEGIGKGDLINLFGKNITIVAVNESLKNFGDFTNGFVYGTPYKPEFVDTQTPVEFGSYKVEVLDIDVKSEKALIRVTDTTTGESETTTLYAEDVVDNNKITEEDTYDVLFDGGIYIKLKSAFVGISGTTAAEIEVATDLKGVKKGDELIPGWKVAEIGIVNKKIQSLELTNGKDLKGPINLFDTFTIKYSVDVKKGSCDFCGSKAKKTYGVAAAWIDFDPMKFTKEVNKTVKIGDELSGWTVDSIKATTIVPGEVKPVTVLDTEIMAEGLDKVDSNLILVGGPVVNKVTAALAEELGVPANYTGWKEKFGTGKESGVVKYLAKCAAINDHGVVLVAGTDREGTKAAAEALMEYIASLS